MEKHLEELKLSQKLNGYLLEKLRLLVDGSLPNRDIHLQLTELLISMTERELKSFNKPTVTNQLQKSEEQLVNGVTEVADTEEEDEFELIIPSYLFEEQGDSLDLELIPSYFFDEVNDADTVDSEVLIPLSFFDEKIWSDRVNVQPKEVLSAEVTGAKQLNLQVILPTTHTRLISDSFLINIDSSRELFDRGREIEIRKGFSDIFRDCAFLSGTNNYSFLVQLNYHYGKFVRELILHHGYASDSLFPTSAVLKFFRTSHKGDGSKLFVKMIERNILLFLLSGRILGIEKIYPPRDQLYHLGLVEWKVWEWLDSVLDYLLRSLSRREDAIALQFHHILPARKYIPCIELFRVLIKGQEGVVLQINMREFIFLLLLHFPISTGVSSHSYLSETVSCQHSSFLGYKAFGGLVVQGTIRHSACTCLYKSCSAWGMCDFDFSIYLLPCYTYMCSLVYHTKENYSWTRIFTRKLRTQVLLIVIQNSAMAMLVVYLRWKFKLPTSENYESLALQEDENKVHLYFADFLLQSLYYTQRDSVFCVWLWILPSVVCFSNYLCYLCSVFDRGKWLDESNFRNDNGNLVSVLELRLSYSTEFQIRFLIVLLLVNYDGGGDGVRLFLEISYIYIGSASIFTLQCTTVMKFSKAHNIFGPVLGKEGAKIFSLNFGFLELKMIYMPLHNLSYLLMGILGSASSYVGLHGFSLMVSLTFLIRSFTLFRTYLFLHCPLLPHGVYGSIASLRWTNKVELHRMLVGTLFMLTVIHIPNAMSSEVSFKWGFTKNGDAQHIYFHCNQLLGLEYQPARGHSSLKPYGRRIGLHFISTLIYFPVVFIFEMPLTWECSLSLMGLLSSGTVNRICLHSPFKLNPHLEWLVTTNGAVIGLCATVVTCNQISHNLIKACRYFPCCSQRLGFLIRHRWRSKEVLFLERKMGTTINPSKAIGVVLNDNFELQRYTQVHSSHEITSPTRSITNSRDGQAKVEGRTGLRPQHSIQFPLELTKSHPLSLMRVVWRHWVNSCVSRLQGATATVFPDVSFKDSSTDLRVFTSFILEDKDVLKGMVFVMSQA